jgi:phenylalanine-4-hydroxylase
MKCSSYQSHQPDPHGLVAWDDEENAVWSFLYCRQMQVIQGRACDAFVDGLNLLALPDDRVPQIPELNERLRAASGWEVAAVPALIPFGTFFELLASRKFPAATFIRRREHIDYLQEPDIFHEIFGHCPLLTDPVFAEFVHRYGQLGLAAGKQERVYLARIFWLTVEFGLIRSGAGTRIYGAGILSSKGETEYAADSPLPRRESFDIEEMLRTPYRIDIMQPLYYVIDDFEQLYREMNEGLLPKIRAAIELGDRPPLFSPKETGAIPDAVC